MTGSGLEGEGQLYLDDFQVGDMFAGEWKIVTQEDFLAFARLTGDAHPIHYDEDYARKTRFGRRLAHGLLVVSLTALGATSMSRRVEESMVAFGEEAFRFLKPVFVDDEVRSEFEVAAVKSRPDRDVGTVRFEVRLVGRDGMAFAEGHHIYLFKRRGSVAG